VSDEHDLDDGDRDLIERLRALPQPKPPVSLARDIHAAIDREASRRPWFLRPMFGVALAAVTAVAVGVFVVARDRTHAIDRAHDLIDAGAAIPPPHAQQDLFAGSPAIAGELPDLETLDDHAIDRLAADLDDLDPDAPTAADDGLLPQPDLEWVDELSPADVDSLDTYLDTQATHRSPT